MIASFIETWDAEGDLSCSIYRKHDDSLTVWVKLGISVFEVPHNLFGNLSELINFIEKRLKEIESER
jgi:hypothetical protein